MRIADGDVPPPLRNVTLRTLDLALLQAGAGVKGEFENRLKGLIEEVKDSPTPIILFIDEAHTMIGAGGQAGQDDAANLLKPALARGELRTIAATTWSEYKKYFEKDPALARRFQVVKVEEPTEDVCLRHAARHRPRARDASQRAHPRRGLSTRPCGCRIAISPDRQLPDKAVSVLDTACARLALGQNATPPAIEERTRTLDDLAVQRARARARSERSAPITPSGSLTIAEQRRRRPRPSWPQLQRALGAGDASWSPDPRAARDQLRAGIEAGRRRRGRGDHASRASLRRSSSAEPRARDAAGRDAAGARLRRRAARRRGDLRLDRHPGRQDAERRDRHRARRSRAPGRARHRTGSCARSASASAFAPRAPASRIRSKPIGVFLLVGPSGVGKTETALALSDLLYGGEHNLITINMSEFQEAHTVSTLKGSPPGYVGYGEGGVLTEAVRRRPYSVVLLDEVEKAHPDVLELFFQVFDKGVMEDGEGRQIDFKNTIIILTSNAGTDTIMKLTRRPGDDADRRKGWSRRSSRSWTRSSSRRSSGAW